MRPRPRPAAPASLGVLLVAALVGCAEPRPGTPAARTRALADLVAGNPQGHRLSCESRSAADLLAVHGLAASEERVLARLPRADNPDEGFVGDVDGPPGQLPPDGYGVHAEPIAAVLRLLGLDARAELGRTMAWLRSETDAGRPVIAWITGGCSLGRPEERRDAAGVPFRCVRGEHTVLVVGVRGSDVVAIDPATGRRTTFEEGDFDASWALLGRMAVSAKGRLAR